MTLAAAALTPLVVLSACGGGSGGRAAGGDWECGSAQLRLSHQWPAATGEEDSDFRSELAQQFSDKVNEATDGQVTVRIYPGSSRGLRGCT